MKMLARIERGVVVEVMEIPDELRPARGMTAVEIKPGDPVPEIGDVYGKGGFRSPEPDAEEKDAVLEQVNRIFGQALKRIHGTDDPLILDIRRRKAEEARAGGGPMTEGEDLDEIIRRADRSEKLMAKAEQARQRLQEKVRKAKTRKEARMEIEKSVQRIKGVIDGGS